DCEVVHHLDPKAAEPSVTMIERLECSESADIKVGEKGRAVNRIGFNQRYIKIGSFLLDKVSGRGATGATPHNHDFCGALGDRKCAPGGGGQRARAGQLAEIAPGKVPHLILPNVDAYTQPVRCKIAALWIARDHSTMLRAGGNVRRAPKPGGTVPSSGKVQMHPRRLEWMCVAPY